MKRKWHVQRLTQAYPDGEQRWDRAYQYLLAWATAIQTTNPSDLPQAKEAFDANSSLRPSLDDQPSPSPND
ncbi:MAG: hypothetical protein M1546_09380 [Chloroflexi bacterium]|nr:hypothetical protein [Chloroflexota bacterium]